MAAANRTFVIITIFGPLFILAASALPTLVSADGSTAFGAIQAMLFGDKAIGAVVSVFAFSMLMYMTVLLYGQLIGRSILQEKTNKTVEIMLSIVSPRQLLAGKIIGPALAGILQYMFWILMITVGSNLASSELRIAVPRFLGPAHLGWLLAFFVPAYFLYASIYAALGACAENEHHLSQIAWPVILILIIPLLIMPTFLIHPDSAISRFFSFFPLTSPIVMLIRILVSFPPWCELVLGYAILLFSLWIAIILAAKIFRVGILMTGKRHTFAEIRRWTSIK